MACDVAHEEKKENSTPNKSESRQRRDECITTTSSTNKVVVAAATATSAVAAPPRTIVAAQEHAIRSRIDRFIAGFGLTPMGKAVALNWIQTIGVNTSGDYKRVRGWLVGRLNAFGREEHHGISGGVRSATQREGVSPWQSGCPEIIPGLRSKAFWGSEELPWLADFENGFEDVKTEFLSLKGRGGFQPYRAPRGGSCDRPAADGVGSHCHTGGGWNVFYIFLHNVDFEQNRSMCPKTCALVESLPRHHRHAFFSTLAPGTHIVKHHGPTNKKLRVHLPLVTPGGSLARLRVGCETREVCAGRAFVFDDSFEHETWNDDHGDKVEGSGGNVGEESRGKLRAADDGEVVAPRPRVTLIADVWHPDLSPGEVRFLGFLQQATLRLEKRCIENSARGVAPTCSGVDPSSAAAPAAAAPAAAAPAAVAPAADAGGHEKAFFFQTRQGQQEGDNKLTGRALTVVGAAVPAVAEERGGVREDQKGCDGNGDAVKAPQSLAPESNEKLLLLQPETVPSMKIPSILQTKCGRDRRGRSPASSSSAASSATAAAAGHTKKHHVGHSSDCCVGDGSKVSSGEHPQRSTNSGDDAGGGDFVCSGPGPLGAVQRQGGIGRGTNGAVAGGGGGDVIV